MKNYAKMSRILAFKVRVTDKVFAIVTPFGLTA